MVGAKVSENSQKMLGNIKNVVQRTCYNHETWLTVSGMYLVERFINKNNRMPLAGTSLSLTMREKVELAWQGYSRLPWDSTNHGSDALHAVVFLF